MKRLILFELILLFLATTFNSDNPPPGWYQQTLPVNDQINDIFFLDSLNGWVVTDGRTSINDTGYIFRTTNGGINWSVQYNQPMKLVTVQFTDNNTGYVSGGSGTGTARVFKTTNGGINWYLAPGNLLGLGDLDDMFFVNINTGWVCDEQTFGGLLKTTNGGGSWSLQLNDTYRPTRLFFLNSDTGWAVCNSTKLYRTINGGTNWNLQFTFAFNNTVRSIFFVNNFLGWTTNYSPSDTNGIFRTTDGGFTWQTQVDPEEFSSGNSEIYIVSSDTGYIATAFSKILKTTNSGINWFKQDAPNYGYSKINFANALYGWAGFSILIHTTDGGGPPVGIVQTGNEIPTEYKLYQNYPNPFNPLTNIKYQIVNSKNVKIIVYNIQGEEIKTLVNQMQNAGTYQIEFDGTDYSSGIYIYSLFVNDKLAESRKMILIK